MAKAIEMCLQSNRHIVIEAPTGTGKSLAYLVPSIIWAINNQKKVMISTATKILQRQIIEKDLPLLQKVIGNFDFAICIGGDNYFCPARFENVLQYGLFSNDSEMHTLNKLSAWYKEKGGATQYDIDFFVDPYIWRKVCRNRYICSNSCGHKNHCGFYQSVQHMKNATVLVSNHHYTFINIKSRSNIIDEVGAIVFDEAHEVEDTATAAFSEEINSSQIKSLFDILLPSPPYKGVLESVSVTKKTLTDMSHEISEAKKEINHIHSQIPYGSSIMGTAGTELFDPLMRRLSILAEIIEKEDKSILTPYKSQIEETVKSLFNICAKEEHKNYVYWTSAAKKAWKAAATPINISGYLKRQLLYSFSNNGNGNSNIENNSDRPLKLAVFASATISINNNMQYFKGRVGLLKDTPELVVSSPFDYKKQAVIYAPRLPDPSSSDYHNAVFNHTMQLLRIYNGRTLILFTSFKFMDEMYNMLKDARSDLVIMKQGDMSCNQLVVNFKKTNKAILLGANTFWQGVDIPGDALQCVIMTKLPFLPPDDPLTIARQKQLKDKGLNPFIFYQVPKAVLMFKQGFGRLIRTVNDKGVVAILDSRIHTKRYGKMFLKSLPECNVCQTFPVSAFPRSATENL